MLKINLIYLLLALVTCPCIFTPERAYGQAQAIAPGACRVKVFRYSSENVIIFSAERSGTSTSSYTDLDIQPIAYIRNTGTKPVKIKLHSTNPPVGSFANSNGNWYPDIPAGGRNPFVTGINEPYSSRVSLRGIKCDASVNDLSSLVDPVVGNPSELNRRLYHSEIQIATSVFRSSVDLSKVRVSNQIGGGNRPWVSSIPFGDQTIHVGPNLYPSSLPSALLVHELVHVWQYQRGGLVGVNSILTGQTYDYLLGSSGTPYKSWESFNVEQQAQIVEDWYRQGMSSSDRRFPYIRDCVRPRRTNCTPSGTVP